MTFDLFLYHVAFAGIVVLLTQSLNQAWKIDLFSLGHHGFFGLGAYVGVLTIELVGPAEMHWFVQSPGHRVAGFAFLLSSVGIAGMVTMTVAWVLGRVLHEIRGDYFAVATLVFAELVQTAAANSDVVGGGIGYEVPYLVATNSAAERGAFVVLFVALVWLANIALYLLIRRYERSAFGLFSEAIRADSLAAELSGIDVEQMQNVVFALSAGVAGGAGVFFLHFTTMVVPTDFSFINGIPIVLYVVLGGLSRTRCVVAALIVYALYEMIKLRMFGIVGDDVGRVLASWKEVLLGLLLLSAVLVPKWAAHARRSGGTRS